MINFIIGLAVGGCPTDMFHNTLEGYIYGFLCMLVGIILFSVFIIKSYLTNDRGFSFKAKIAIILMIAILLITSLTPLMCTGHYY